MLSVPEMRSAIDSALKASSVEAFDLLGFDACLMNSYVVLGTLAPLARYILASEELEPGHGWDYSFLAALNPPLGQPPGPVQAGKAISDLFLRQAAEQSTDTITLALVEGGAAFAAFEAKVCPLHSTPYALAPTPYALRPGRHTLHLGPAPRPLDSTPYASHNYLVNSVSIAKPWAYRR